MARALAEALLLGLALITLVPITMLFAEVMLAITRPRRTEPESSGDRPSIAVLVPAHDEASVIAQTLRSIAPQLCTSDRIVVVADNCSDETGAVATREGADVVTRKDALLKGKGYALDWGIRYLSSKPPQVVIIIDADCNASVGSIGRLARECLRTGRPVQALYLMHAPSGSGIKTRIAQFAFLLRNQVRPMGLHRLGLPCQLMGSGMAFPWSLIGSSNLATAHITEDLKLGIELAQRGFAARFCPNALITSLFPASQEGIRSQRTRWEHGNLSILLTDAPRLLRDAIARGDPRLLALGLDLCVPPLALLSFATVAIWVASAVLYAVASVRQPFDLMTAGLGLLVMSVLLSWARYGRNILSARDLLVAPLYALWKIPLYVRFLRERQLEWVRSKRDTTSGL
jgi:cellulose synthase/poly-beta-1,6-N-acetylglucosamine synthase-like glycosyltransferase